jgi:hypothetical protein
MYIYYLNPLLSTTKNQIKNLNNEDQSVFNVLGKYLNHVFGNRVNVNRKRRKKLEKHYRCDTNLY